MKEIRFGNYYFTECELGCIGCYFNKLVDAGNGAKEFLCRTSLFPGLCETCGIVNINNSIEYNGKSEKLRPTFKYRENRRKP